MVTSPNEWKILQWVKNSKQTNKQTNLSYTKTHYVNISQYKQYTTHFQTQCIATCRCKHKKIASAPNCNYLTNAALHDNLKCIFFKVLWISAELENRFNERGTCKWCQTAYNHFFHLTPKYISHEMGYFHSRKFKKKKAIKLIACFSTSMTLTLRCSIIQRSLKISQISNVDLAHQITRPK